MFLFSPPITQMQLGNIKARFGLFIRFIMFHISKAGIGWWNWTSFPKLLNRQQTVRWTKDWVYAEFLQCSTFYHLVFQSSQLCTVFAFKVLLGASVCYYLQFNITLHLFCNLFCLIIALLSGWLMVDLLTLN